MSSKLKKAENLLKNLHASVGELESLAAEMTVTLVDNSSTFDNATKERYASLIARLNVRAGRDKSSERIEKGEKHKQKHQMHYIKRTESSSAEDSYKNSASLVVVSKNVENKYILPDFFPNSANKELLIWLNYVDMQKVRQSPKIMVMTDKTELVLTDRIPSLWIGDFKVLSRNQLTAYRTTFEVEPVINFERVKKLYEFYTSNYEYMPVRKGELFYVRTPPVKANKPSNHNNHYNTGKVNKIMPSKVADYFVRAGGFVIFVKGIDESVLTKSGNVFDFVYTGTNHSNTSGRATFVKDSIRKLVTENFQQYLTLENKQKSLL